MDRDEISPTDRAQSFYPTPFPPPPVPERAHPDDQESRKMSFLQKVIASQAGPQRSQSVPFIHEKWRRSPMLIREDGVLRGQRDYGVVVARLRLGIRVLQTILMLVIVVLMAQSLMIFQATRNGLIDASTLIWPRIVEIWPTIMVLTFAAVIMILSFVLVGGYFCNSNVISRIPHRTTLLLIFTALTTGLYITSAIILKTQPLSALPLWQVSCALAAQTNRYDHITVCRSHNWTFIFLILAIAIDLALLLTLLWSQRRPTKEILRRSRESMQSRLNAFKFDVRGSVQMPAPTHALMLYPGRVWRLEWGDMKDYEMKVRDEERAPLSGVTSPISPGAVRSPSPKMYF